MKEAERIHAARRVPLTNLQLCVHLQALEGCQYELVAPLAIMFSSTLLQVQMRHLPNHFNILLSCSWDKTLRRQKGPSLGSPKVLLFNRLLRKHVFVLLFADAALSSGLRAAERSRRGVPLLSDLACTFQQCV